MCNNDNPTISVPTATPASPASTTTTSSPSSPLATFVNKSAATIETANFQSGSFGPVAAMSQVALDYHRLQLYDYACATAGRIRYGHPAVFNSVPYPVGPYGPNQAAAFASIYGHPFGKYDPRMRFMHEEPKPQHSYIGLIGMAILSLPDKKMVLSDIYQYILDNYAYFRNRGPGWRNSIRHNLSLNDCFIKAGRSANGKGHYWAVHPANVDDFQKGDFRRRKAQRKVRKHMGLSVPDDEDSPSPPPPPPHHHHPHFQVPMWQTGKPASHHHHHHHPMASLIPVSISPPREMLSPQTSTPQGAFHQHSMLHHHRRPRQFDVESLLAPEKTDNDLSTSEVSDNSPNSSPVRINDDEDDDNDQPIDLEKKPKSAAAAATTTDQENVSIPHFHGLAQNANIWSNPIWSHRFVGAPRHPAIVPPVAMAAMAAAAMQSPVNGVFWNPFSGLHPRQTSAMMSQQSKPVDVVETVSREPSPSES